MNALTPARCLRTMADYLGRMEDAQERFRSADRDYTDGVSGSSTERDRAIADTGYYAAQAQTWALAASALLAGMDRYPQSVRNVDDDEFRDGHVPVPGADRHEGWRIEHGEAVRVR